MLKDTIILGVETSCDETAAAYVLNGRRTLGASISTQIDIHALYGGVVPEIASRKHVESLDAVVRAASEQAGIGLRDVDAIAVTSGPGLVGALLCGVSWAKAAAFALQKPLVAVHHIAGHIAANYVAFPELEPPFTCLVVSGGHTHLYAVERGGAFALIGKTRDDAAGEAFDKAARALGLAYPGGPLLDKLAEEGDETTLALPKPRVEENEFSFSGLKSALLQALERNPDLPKADAAASFRRAVVDALATKAVAAALRQGSGRLAIAGGVACNSLLRRELVRLSRANGIEFFCPPPHLCADNAEMIAAEGFLRFSRGEMADFSLNATPSWPLGM